MKKGLILLIVLVLVSGVFWLWFFRQSKIEQTAQTPAGVYENSDVSPAALNAQDSPTSVELGKLSSYTGDPIDNIGNDPFIQQVPADYLEKYKQELANFKKTLTENPGDAEAWARVGVLKKFFNNYEGARDAWEYAKIVNPEFSTPYYNLGGLYAGYLKDNLKAEENYLKAIEIDSALPYLYLGLAEFYSVFYKEKSDQVEQVLQRGLKILPGDESLLRALESYKSTASP